MNARRSAVDRHEVVPDARRVTFETLLALLLADYGREGSTSLGTPPSADHYKLKHLRAAFAGRPAASISTARMAEYQAARRAAGASRATINNESALVRRMFTLAHEAELPVKAPVIKTPNPKNARVGFFEPATFGRLLAALPAYLAPVASFAYFTGWRKQEILGLTWDRVDFRVGVVRLEPNSTKNDEGRTLPFKGDPALKRLLEQQLARRAATEATQGNAPVWVFPGEAGERIRDFYTAWRNACKVARCIGMVLHDLRRTAVRNFVRAGIGEQRAMKLSGHKTREIFDRYDIVDEQDLRDAVAKVAASREPVPVTP